MPRFLHTADWQIGRHYGRFAADDAVALSEARFGAVERIAGLAAAERYDAVLVAGDVFDAQTVADRTIRRLFNALAGFSGPWIMIPGNHDAALAESVWTRALRLGAIPANVHVLIEPRPLVLPDVGIAVLPAPLTQRQTHADLTAWFDSADTPAGLLRVGLAHGSVQGILPAEIDSPNPIAPDRARCARLDYLALGDWHGVKQIDPRTWYSGTPEAERFRDTGAGHVLGVTISAPGAAAQVQVLPIGQYRWLRQETSLAVASDLDRCLEMLAALPTPAVLEVVVTGHIDLAGRSRLLEALAIAEARHRSLRLDLSDLHLHPTDADLAALHVDGYLGEVIAELRELQDQPGGDRAREALTILAELLQVERPGASA